MRKLILFLIIFCTANLAFAKNIEDLEVSLLKGDADRVIRELSGSSNSSEDCYLLGLAYLKKQEFQKARENLQTALDKTRSQALKDKIQLAVADSFFLEQKFQEAQELYALLLKKRTNNGQAALLLLRLAQCNLKSGNWEAGNQYLNKLRAEFPNSLETQMSDSLSSTEEFFCVQAGSFANEKNALDLAQHLKSQGLDVYVSAVTVGDKTIYRVRAGECESRLEAEELKARIDGMGYETKIYP